MDIPNFPNLDSSSDEGSIDSPPLSEIDTSSTDENEATTAVTIKPGGEDNDPIQPKRSVSPVPPKISSHRKMAKSRLTNPLDAFDRSPETLPSPKAVVSISPKQKKQNNINSNMGSKDNANNSNNTSNQYGYEDAAPTRRGKNSPVPPMSMSSGAARALRRGVPASEASGGLGGPPLSNGGGGPTRRLPQRSNLKKSSSFNVGDKKQHLRSGGLRHSSHGTSTPVAEEEEKQGKEPIRGVMRRASMGCTHTTTIEVRVRGERFPVQRRRSINFDQTVEIKEVEPVPEMVSGNCSEIWLQEEDFVKMKQERRNLVQKVKKKHQQKQLEQQQVQQEEQQEKPKAAPKLSPEEASAMRGLEKYVDKSIRAAKNLAWDTVLLEQDEQELSGEYNDERIADLYRHFTRESPHKAVVRAKQDEQEIQDYLWSPRTTKLMLRRLPTPAPAVLATGDDSSASAAVTSTSAGS